MIGIWILMKKPVCLGPSILDISENVMYEFWYDYVKSKYREKAKLYYLDKDTYKKDKIYLR